MKKNVGLVRFYLFYYPKNKEINIKATVAQRKFTMAPPPAEKTNMQHKLNKQPHVTSKRRHQSAPCRIYASLCEASVPYFLVLWKDLKGAEARGWGEVVTAGSRISGWSCRELLALVWQLIARPRAWKQPHIAAWQWLSSRRQHENTLATTLKADRCLHYCEE